MKSGAVDRGPGAGSVEVTPKRSSTRRYTNTLAKSVVDQATGNAPAADGGKNPAAVALGRLGGLKGAKARAAKLTKAQRSEIAKRAAKKRCGGKP